MEIDRSCTKPTRGRSHSSACRLVTERDSAHTRQLDPGAGRAPDELGQPVPPGHPGRPDPAGDEEQHGGQPEATDYLALMDNIVSRVSAGFKQ